MRFPDGLPIRRMLVCPLQGTERDQVHHAYGNRVEGEGSVFGEAFRAKPKFIDHTTSSLGLVTSAISRFRNIGWKRG
jgi:hypothetical protein